MPLVSLSFAPCHHPTLSFNNFIHYHCVDTHKLQIRSFRLSPAKQQYILVHCQLNVWLAIAKPLIQMFEF